MKHAKFVSFTEVGAKTAERAARLLPDFLCERYARTVDPSLSNTSLSRFAQQAMVDCGLIVFVGAVGIAVRAVAPYLAGKAYDPAVVVTDEQGRFVIPLLSGHLGGANELAQRLADGLGATAVITTATDGREVFAVDNWAKAHDCAVFDPENIKFISGELLRGGTVGLRTAFPVDGRLPAHIDLKADAECGFTLGFDTKAQPFAHTLHLVPRIVSLGLGCRKGVPMDVIAETVREALAAADVPMAAETPRASTSKRTSRDCCRSARKTVCRLKPSRRRSFRTRPVNLPRPSSSEARSAWTAYANARRCWRAETAVFCCESTRKTA